MFKKTMQKAILMFVGLVGICSASQVVNATDYSDLTKNAPLIYGESSLDANGDTTISWISVSENAVDESAQIAYEVQVAKNSAFTNAKQYSTKTDTLKLNKSEFGTNGGKFYVRVRLVIDYVDATQTDLTSAWSEVEEMIFVKINKTNFPGMYKVLKNGGQYNSEDGVKKIKYDKNKDSWLDPVEIDDITILGTVDTYKKKNGKNKLIKATNISSFKGIEYLPRVSSVSIDRYSGKKADLSKCKAYHVSIEGVSAKQLTVNAPNAELISIQPDIDTKITKIDVSKCKNVVDLLVYGNEGTKTLKLPKNKDKLKVLSLSEYGFRSINLNGYTNLQQVYFYECDVKSVKVNKCKDLRYVYFYYCDKIKSLNLTSNKKLRGADFYQSPGLTKTTVKRPKNGKYTWNKGKWWYGTKKYQKDMKKLYN